MFLIVFALICCIIFVLFFLWWINKCLHFCRHRLPSPRVTSAMHIDLIYYTLTRYCYYFQKTVKSCMCRTACFFSHTLISWSPSWRPYQAPLVCINDISQYLCIAEPLLEYLPIWQQIYFYVWMLWLCYIPLTLQ